MFSAFFFIFVGSLLFPPFCPFWILGCVEMSHNDAENMNEFESRFCCLEAVVQHFHDLLAWTFPLASREPEQMLQETPLFGKNLWRSSRLNCRSHSFLYLCV